MTEVMEGGRKRLEEGMNPLRECVLTNSRKQVERNIGFYT